MGVWVLGNNPKCRRKMKVMLKMQLLMHVVNTMSIDFTILSMDRHNILRMIVVKKFFCRFLTKLELFVVYFSFVNNTLEGGYCAVHTHSKADNNRISLLESLLPSLSLFLDLFLVADTRL